MTINAAIKTQTGNIRSPKSRMLWPTLFKARPPKGETDPTKARFSITLLVPKDAKLDVLAEAIAKAKLDKFGADYAKKFKIKSPILKTEDDPKLAEYAEEFPIMIRCSSRADSKPQTVGPNRAPVEDTSTAYGGRWCYASLSPWCYDHPTGGKGVSIDLKAVQLAEDAEPIGAGPVNAQNEFEDIGGVASSDDMFA